MADQPSSNSRIARNALMLYVRMFITMIVSLFTSRVVLNTLGVEDYGTYGVVGGVVGMMAFLNASMSGATSRFLTFELGRGNKERLARTFSSAIIAHVIIALVVIVLAETVGLWFMMNKLVIPEGRETAAMWVYQLSVVGVLFTFTQVPYNASIIAHEKMDIYAYVEILNVGLKLLIVYLLWIGNFDKLILYAILIFVVQLVIMMVYRIYCLRHFEETHFHWVWDTSILKPLASFSGWDLYGNMSVTVRQQGISVLQNMYFGVAINAAAGIAGTVVGMLNALSKNVVQAFRPPIIKSYATGEYATMQQHMQRALKYSLAMYLAMSVPLYFEAHYVLHLWLGLVPDHTVNFLRLVLISTIFGQINAILIIGIHATGDIRWISLVSGSLFLVSIVPVWLLFRYFAAPTESAYWVAIVSDACIVLCNLLILRRLVPALSMRRLLLPLLPKNVVAVAVTVACSYPLLLLMPDESFLRLVIVVLASVAVYTALFAAFILSAGERSQLVAKLKSRFAHA